jgi:hypothetical protein
VEKSWPAQELREVGECKYFNINCRMVVRVEKTMISDGLVWALIDVFERGE